MIVPPDLSGDPGFAAAAILFIFLHPIQTVMLTLLVTIVILLTALILGHFGTVQSFLVQFVHIKG